MPKAAPRPVFGLFHQSALYRIAVQVAQLFHEIPVVAKVTVIVTRLPKRPGLAVLRPQPANLLGRRQLYPMQHVRQGGTSRFAEEQVHVLRHQEVAIYAEVELPAGRFQRGQQYPAESWIIQVRRTPIATEGDEMRVPGGL